MNHKRKGMGPTIHQQAQAASVNARVFQRKSASNRDTGKGNAKLEGGQQAINDYLKRVGVKP